MFYLLGRGALPSSSSIVSICFITFLMRFELVDENSKFTGEYPMYNVHVKCDAYLILRKNKCASFSFVPSSIFSFSICDCSELRSFCRSFDS